jgi:hypothetical protein
VSGEASERAATLRSYRELGYAVVRGLFSVEAIDAVLREVDGLFTGQLRRLGQAVPDGAGDGEAALRARMEALLALDVPTYLATARHAAKLMSLQALAVSAPVVALLGELGLRTPSLPTTPVVHIMGDTLRIPGGYYGLAAHQDWPSIQGALGSVVVWTPLTDVDARRFPVELIPRSHLRGLWPGVITRDALEIQDGLRDADFVRAPARPGDALIFSVFTVHRTALQGCSGMRIAASARYESSEEPTFIARGFPCAYKRTVERQLPSDGFPAPADVTALFRAPAR